MIFVLSGKARSGKDTSACFISDILSELGRCSISIAYADFLKEIMGKCFNLSYDQLYGNDKESPIEYLPIRTRSGKVTNHYWTPRKLFQFFGTDVFRTVHPDCWINVVKNFVEDNKYDYDDIIITDGRFSNEIDWVLQDNGVHIHIIRENKDYSSGTDHASEVDLDDFFDERSYLVENNKHLAYLKNTLEDIIKKEISYGR